MATAILNEPVVAGNPAHGIVHVEFHGFKIPTIMHDDKPHFAIKPICEAIGLDFSSQLRNIKRGAVLGTCVVKLTMQMPGDDQAREYAFLPVHFFNGWIFKVDANRYVKKTIREALIAYQREGYDVMCAYFNRGIAVNPRVLDDAPANPSTAGNITPAQQQELQNIVAAKASAFPREALGRIRAQIWSRLHNKFKVAKYDQLPASAFPEAVEYLVALEVRGALPAPENAAQALPALPDTLPDSLAGKLRQMRALKHEMMDISAEVYHIAKRSIRPKFTEHGRPAFSLLVNMNETAEDVLYALDRNLDALEHLCIAGELAAKVFVGGVGTR